MKVYIVMLYDHEEFHVGNVYSHWEDAKKEIGDDKFDMIEVREVRDKPIDR
jgi:hypothetical protein